MISHILEGTIYGHDPGDPLRITYRSDRNDNEYTKVFTVHRYHNGILEVKGHTAGRHRITEDGRFRHIPNASHKVSTSKGKVKKIENISDD